MSDEAQSCRTISQRALRLAALPVLISLFRHAHPVLPRAGGDSRDLHFSCRIALVDVGDGRVLGRPIVRRGASISSAVAKSYHLCSAFKDSCLCALVDYQDVRAGYALRQLGQALVGQLVHGSLVQIIPGGLLGSVILAIKRRS
jgi:hypothetical protein